MNKKGFTLIEVLAIVILIGIIMTIIISIVDDDLDFAKSYASDAQIRLIEESASIYYDNYKSEISNIDVNNVGTVTVQTLYDKGFIKDKDLKINSKVSVNKTDLVIIYIIDEEVFTIYDRTQSTNPRIILKGPKEIKLSKNSNYTEYGAVVIDLINKTINNVSSISGTVNTSTEGTYSISYSYNGAATVQRKIIIENSSTTSDDIKPIITINGSAVINISLGSQYNDLGATAEDNKDGNITSRITKTGKVDTSTKGTYYINYDVTDAAGNKGITVTRTINVN